MGADVLLYQGTVWLTGIHLWIQWFCSGQEISLVQRS